MPEQECDRMSMESYCLWLLREKGWNAIALRIKRLTWGLHMASRSGEDSSRAKVKSDVWVAVEKARQWTAILLPFLSAVMSSLRVQIRGLGVASILSPFVFTRITDLQGPFLFHLRVAHHTNGGVDHLLHSDVRLSNVLRNRYAFNTIDFKIQPILRPFRYAIHTKVKWNHP